MFGLNVFFAGCDERDKPAIQTTQSPSKISDSDLEKGVRAKLDSDSQLGEAHLGVGANVDKNEVTLSATVRSEDTRAKAVEFAKSVQSGLTVNDKIEVKPAA